MSDTVRSVCMFTNLYPPVVSGSSTQSFCLARELARRRCKVVVITSRISTENAEYEQDEGVDVYRLPALRLPPMGIALNFPWLNYTFTPGNLQRIEKILKQHDPDVLHLHSHMFDLALSAVLMRRRFKKPLVVTVHAMIKHARNAYNLFLYPADRLLLRNLIIRQADVIVSPDVNMQEYVRQAFGRTDSIIVPYGIDLPKALPDGQVERLRQKYHLDGKRVILSLGHVHEIRNRRDLIGALPDVLKVYPETVLLVAGAVSTTLPAVLARKLGVHDSIIFAGYVPHAEVPALLALAELEVHWLNQDVPERTSLGIASLEAMQAGKVALAAANPNTYGPGILEDGENIVLVEPGKPRDLAQIIVSLLSDPERCRAIGGRAAETIEEHFSWDNVCERTLALYWQAAQESPWRQLGRTRSS